MKKFGTGGDVNYSYGGNNQINKQRTRFGSKFGYKLNAPDENLLKYEGKKKGGLMATKGMHSEKGEMKEDLAQDKKMIKKAIAMHDKQEHPGKKTDLSKLKGGGMARMMSKGEHTVQKRSKRGAEMVKMARGGGVEVRGKTKGKMIAMCSGGMAKKK